MTQSKARLQRYPDDKLEECRSEDVDRRLDELSTLVTVLEGSASDE